MIRGRPHVMSALDTVVFPCETAGCSWKADANVYIANRCVSVWRTDRFATVRVLCDGGHYRIADVMISHAGIRWCCKSINVPFRLKAAIPLADMNNLST